MGWLVIGEEMVYWLASAWRKNVTALCEIMMLISLSCRPLSQISSYFEICLSTSTLLFKLVLPFLPGLPTMLTGPANSIPCLPWQDGGVSLMVHTSTHAGQADAATCTTWIANDQQAQAMITIFIHSNLQHYQKEAYVAAGNVTHPSTVWQEISGPL